MNIFVYLIYFCAVVCRASGFSVTSYANLEGSIIQNGTRLKLICVSTYQSYGDSCEFIVNGYVQEQIRWYKNDCFDSKGRLCSPFYCSCDASSKTILLPATRFKKSISTFGCKLRFEDFASKEFIEVRSSKSFNGTDFKDYSYHIEVISHDHPSKESVFSGASVIVMIVTTIGVLVCFLWITIYLYRTHCKGRSKDGNESEYMPLLDPEKESSGNQCSRCTAPTSCAYCTTCMCCLCKICYDDHERNKQDHHTYQIEHISTKNIVDYCSRCKKEKAMKVCKSCEKLCCLNCKCACTGSKIPFIIVLRTDCASERKISRASTKSNHSNYKVGLRYQIKLDDASKSRICGLTFVEDSRIAVADEYKKCIDIFKQGKFQFSHYLDREPRGMTGIIENSIAVTFAYETCIQIFEVSDGQVKSGLQKNTNDLGKPYSICYNGDHFAVKFGKGKDGFIAILDNTLNAIKRIVNLSVADFTGNTIRLALDWNKEHIYVSDISKSKLTCINLEGQFLWNKTVPSSRGILHPPGHRHILIANKSGDSVYRINDGNGEIETLITGSQDAINTPRFLAYDTTNQLLGVQVDKGHKISVFDFDIDKRDPVAISMS